MLEGHAVFRLQNRLFDGCKSPPKRAARRLCTDAAHAYYQS